jgi:hypothetical protein
MKQQHDDFHGSADVDPISLGSSVTGLDGNWCYFTNYRTPRRMKRRKRVQTAALSIIEKHERQPLSPLSLLSGFAEQTPHLE